MKPDLLLLFTRYPEAGKVKTRLVPSLGAENAANLQRGLTIHILQTAKSFTQNSTADLIVYFDGSPVHEMQKLFSPEFCYRQQSSGDLGQRMFSALADSLRQGRRRVVLIGSDCPEITSQILDSAFSRLTGNDLVLGPARDGGYYLLGLTSPYPELFDAIPWGTNKVLALTQARAASLGLKVALLEPLDDIDRPEDLPVWEKISRRWGWSRTNPCKKISVVIPTLNEADNIRATLDSLRIDPDPEIIVVDGGSTDATCDLALAEGVTVLRTSRGRARQQNLGAAAAAGKILLFLHGDTLVPADYASLIRRALQIPGVSAGAFSLSINGDQTGLKTIAAIANLRSRWLHLPYGDQGLFLPAELFFRLRGFPEQSIMEDYAFVRRLQRHGRVLTLPETVLTSGRRWQQVGLWRTTYINQLMILGYCLGIAPITLARLYRR